MSNTNATSTTTPHSTVALETSALPTTAILNQKNRKLLLKNQLHLNLNVNNNENMGNVRLPANIELCGEVQRARGGGGGGGAAAAAAAELVKFKDDVSYIETTTVTTVPQIQQKQQKSIIDATKRATTSISSSVAAAATAAAPPPPPPASSSSLLNSSPSALAKFNRIIDSTMPATDCYQKQFDLQQQEQQKQPNQKKNLQDLHDGIVTTTDSRLHKKINFPFNYYDDVGLNVNKNNDSNSGGYNNVKRVVKENDDKEELPKVVRGISDEKDDNQMKRNDVHYLLKQLNSFSDIEEIEIVDMKQTRQQQQALTARAFAASTTAAAIASAAAVITHSPTTTSLVIISPSSQSHKESRHVMRRFASLHQQHQHPEQYQYQYQPHHHHRLKNEQQQKRQQQRHYILNASGGNLIGLGDRIDERFDPAADQQYMLQQFDDYLFESCHYLETNYFAATYRTAMIESSSHEFRPSTTTGTRSSPSCATSSPHTYEIHEVELPSVICRAPPPPPSPTRRFNTQARLTSSGGVQTELTASSFSSSITTTTSHAVNHQSMPKSISGSSGTSACSYASSTEQRRRMPFFKCCYASIERWRRDKRSGAAATTVDKSDKSAGGARGVGGKNASQKARNLGSEDDMPMASHCGSQSKGSQQNRRPQRDSAV